MKVMNGNMETKLEKLSDLQLAKRMSKYISTLQSIRLRADYYSLGAASQEELTELADDYKKVRDSVREDAKYLNYNREKKGSALLWDKYYPSVSEASAWGLYADPEGKFDADFFKSISDAEKRLTKYYSYDYWRIIAEE